MANVYRERGTDDPGSAAVEPYTNMLSYRDTNTRKMYTKVHTAGNSAISGTRG